MNDVWHGCTPLTTREKLALMLASRDKLKARIARGNQPESVYRMLAKAEANITQWQSELSKDRP